MTTIRASLVYYTHSHYYVVRDLWYNTLVIQTSSYIVANYWRSRCNQCLHEIPYDICDHDPRVLALQQLEQGGPAARVTKIR